jgi:hypothetical protein
MTFVICNLTIDKVTPYFNGNKSKHQTLDYTFFWTLDISRYSRCFGIMGGHGKFAFNSVVKLSVELGYVF